MYDTDDLKTGYNSKNVTTGGPVEGGCAYVSFEEEPTLPTTASENLTGSDSDWDNLGELSDQGWSQSTSTSVNKFKGYHGKTLLSEVSDEENTFKVEFLEITRATTTKLRYGQNNVTTDSDGFVTGIDPTNIPDMVVPIVFDELLSNGVRQRTVFPRAKIDSIDDQGHQKGSLLVYGMTFTALVDESGRPYYVRRAKPASATGGDTKLSALSVGSLTLTPTFAAGTTSYAATTSNSSDTVSATANAASSGATVVITVNGNSIASGGTATWQTGENVVKVIVTNGHASKTYTVVVTKSGE